VYSIFFNFRAIAGLQGAENPRKVYNFIGTVLDIIKYNHEIKEVCFECIDLLLLSNLSVNALV